MDQPDVVYKTEEAKFDAVVEDIAERYDAGPAGPGRHDLRWRSPSTSRSCCASGASRTRCSTPSSTNGGEIVAQAGRKGGSRSPPTWPAAAPTSCSAATRSSSPTTSCASAASTRWRPRRTTRPPGRTSSLASAKEAASAEHEEVVEARRPLRAGHRAARVAPHRQPAARPVRPPGRPGRVPVLPVAAGRPDAAVQRGARSSRS